MVGSLTEYEALADRLLKQLFPICRSITGEGVRATLRTLREHIPLEITEVPSGTVCFDWTVPREWNIRDAYIQDDQGKRIIDFQKSNLHVVSYSTPVRAKMTFEELKTHLHTHPTLPDAIPYRSSYYRDSWGFCLTQRQFHALDRNGTYNVCIDSTLAPGSLTLGELKLRGNEEQEFLISTYFCHPSMANDNLSGVVLTTLLAQELKKRKLRKSYRILFAPETIGPIAYLSRNAEAMRKSAGGFVLSTVGGPGEFGYKETFLGNHLIDRVVKQVFRERKVPFRKYSFEPLGSDERQYSSPGFRIPMGIICKDKFYEYDFYHTSLDNLEFVTAKQIVQTFELYVAAIDQLEMNATYLSLNPNCEVQLGKRSLYPQTGGAINPRDGGEATSVNEELDAIFWLMFSSDGKHSLLDIAERSGCRMKLLRETADTLVGHQVLQPI